MVKSILLVLIIICNFIVIVCSIISAILDSKRIKRINHVLELDAQNEAKIEELRQAFKLQNEFIENLKKGE